jgi:hypothetical protein
MLSIANHEQQQITSSTEQPPKPKKNDASICSHRLYLGLTLGLRFRIPSSPGPRNPTSPR